MKEGLYFKEQGDKSFLFEINSLYWDCYSHPAKTRKDLMIKGKDSEGKDFHIEAYSVWELIDSSTFIGKV